MKRTIFTAMKKIVSETLEGVDLELLDVEERQIADRETGEISKFVSVSFMCPRGMDCFSRCQGCVKIPNGRLKVKNDDLEVTEMTVRFKDLEVSFVDNSGNVYFRATDYEVKKED